jgi:hypothetical protein
MLHRVVLCLFLSGAVLVLVGCGSGKSKPKVEGADKLEAKERDAPKAPSAGGDGKAGKPKQVGGGATAD